MNDKLGIAMIGAGAVVEHRHLPALPLTGRAEARAIFDPDRARAEQLAGQFQIARVASSLREAVSSDDIDAVVIASPNSFHREGVERAVEAGKHVFCEKPIALTLRDARAMCQAARQAGLQLFLGFHHRFSAEHLCVRRILQEGWAGEVRAFHSLISEPIEVIPGGLSNYRFRPEQGGGLTLIDVGSHRIDQIRHLLGEVSEVRADMASVLGSHDLDDSVVLTLKMASGALGSLHFHRFSRAFLSPCHLLGTEATVCFGAYITNPFQAAPVALYTERDPDELPPDMKAWRRPESWYSEGRPGWISLWPPRRNSFEEEYRAFFDAIESRRPAPVTGEDGYKALEVVVAGYLSVREKAAIRLPLDPDLSPPTPHF